MRTFSMAASISLVSLLFGAGARADAPAAPEPTPAALSAAAAPAGAAEEPQTITTTGATDHALRMTGWFVAPTFGTTGFGGNLSSSPGLRTGIYLNRRFAIGLTANGLLNGDTKLRHEVKNLGSYGGLLLQYVVQSNSLLHASVETTVGEGRWCNEIHDGDDGDGHQDGCTGRSFMVFEPMANLELNVARHVRLTTGVGYRFAVAGNGPGPSSRDMSSLVVRSGLMFGSF